MAEKQSLKEQIMEKMSTEAKSARDSMAKLFDMTKQTYETYVGYEKNYEKEPQK